MHTRTANLSDLEQLTFIESICFPPEQAAGRESIHRRLEVFPEHFLLLCDDDDKAVAFINGAVTDLPDLTDEMYENASLHRENGQWQMIFGLDTLPAFRRRGYAHKLMNEFIGRAKKQGRKGAVLTCKYELISFYSKLGFVNEGITDRSVIGGIEWYQMRRFF